MTTHRSEPMTLVVTYEWTADIGNALHGERLTCKATLHDVDNPRRVFNTAHAIWCGNASNWELMAAQDALELTWPYPPRDVRPRCKTVNSPDLRALAINPLQVDNIEGRVQILVPFDVHRTDAGKHYVTLGYSKTPADRDLLANVIAHLVTSSGLDLDHDVRPVVSAIYNERLPGHDWKL